MTEGKKIELLKSADITSVFGDTALGKSTFSLKLGKVTNQQTIHLDAIRVKKPGIYYPTEYFLKHFNSALDKGNCILDGTAMDYIFTQLEKSDALVFFDGDNNKIMENFINRLRRVRSGKEVILGFPGFYESDPRFDEQIIEDFKKVVDNYIVKKELLRPKLLKFEDKIITVKNHTEIDNLTQLIRN